MSPYLILFYSGHIWLVEVSGVDWHWPPLSLFFQAYELSTLTGTQVMLLVASETGHVYTFATRKLQPMITSEAGKTLIQTCLNSPDPPSTSTSTADQRMSATGYEETELTYNVPEDISAAEQQQKVRQMMYAANSHYSSVAAAHLFPNNSTPSSQHHQTPTSSSSVASGAGNMQHHQSHSPYGSHPAPSPSPSPMHSSAYGVTSLSPTTSGVHSPGPHLGGASHSPPFLVPHQQHSVAGRWLSAGEEGMWGAAAAYHQYWPPKPVLPLDNPPSSPSVTAAATTASLVELSSSDRFADAEEKPAWSWTSLFCIFVFLVCVVIIFFIFFTPRATSWLLDDAF